MFNGSNSFSDLISSDEVDYFIDFCGHVFLHHASLSSDIIALI